MFRPLRLFLFALLLGFSFSTALANVRLPALVGDHMVLQRDAPIQLWGWADKGERVSVVFLGKTYAAKLGTNGKWTLTLPATPAGGPHEITVRGNNTLTLRDVLVGDVWLGSGQSNMEWTLRMKVNNHEREIAAANYPNIRLFTVKQTTAYAAQTAVESTGWRACSPETVADFSAVAYFFGRALHQQYQVPMGLIITAWGGTVAEAWVSAATLKTLPDFRAPVTEMEQNAARLVQLTTDYQAKLTAWEKEFGYDRGAPARGLATPGKPWSAADYATTDWPTMALPGFWERADVLPDFDGVVWLQKTLNLPAEVAGKPLTLSLAAVDDVDSTWFNGVKVGSTAGYNLPRQYQVPGHLVRAGRNVITVRVLDTGGGGGIYGDPEALYAAVGNQRLSLAGDWAYQTASDQRTRPKSPLPGSLPNVPTVLYNAMVAPLLPYTIKGVIWYQGESNADRAYQYRTLFAALIRDWRQQWGYDFPFLFVQLAGFVKDQPQPADYPWAELREAQAMALALPKTGMAVAIDIGEENDIHPRNKQDVGARLALAARHVAYGEALPYSGPIYKTMRVEGDKIRLTFDNLGPGLLLKDRYGYARGFAIAGEDKKFVWAKVTQDGNELVVSSPAVPRPVAVRYNWGNTPDGNVYNQAMLPAVPFRTDTWRGLTEDNK